MNIINLVFTKRCACCGEIIPQKQLICRDCEKDIHLISEPTCEKCGREINLCSCYKLGRQNFDKIFATFMYNGSIKKSIKLLKFQGIKNPVDFLSGFLEEKYLKVYEGAKIDAIIPVPLHIIKQRERGFNQSFLLAKKLSRNLKVPILNNSLIKIKNTKSQHFLSKEERQNNLKGAFSSNDNVKGKNILLIDDIITTGATLSECAKVIKKAGAKKVYALVVATT